MTQRNMAHGSSLPGLMLHTLVLAAILLLSGCASQGQIRNGTLSVADGESSYALIRAQSRDRDSRTNFTLALSGGGTRAAAFAYGVMKALRNSPLDDSKRTSLLDELDTVTSVSGGSFTAAYYGLHGDGIFDTFEADFLRRDLERSLIAKILNPLGWFDKRGRTDDAISLYDKFIFRDATFADLNRDDGPLILINATDISTGVRFTFVQEYFDMLCSDLGSFPLSSAVTASSAVPLLFNPVVIENRSDCGSEVPRWIKRAERRAIDDPELEITVNGLNRFYQKDKNRYLHLVDGGITDNLGLRSIYDFVELIGGARSFLRFLQHDTPERIVVISVDASNDPDTAIGASPGYPGPAATIDVTSNIQIHRYNVTTKKLIDEMLQEWSTVLSTEDKPVEYYFISLDFKQMEDPHDVYFLNNISTTFTLTNHEVDRLIEAGEATLLNHPEFKRLMRDLGV